MHVLFIEPRFPNYQRQFVRGLREAGARVTAIGESGPEALDDELRHWLYGYERVDSVVEEQQLYDAVRRVQARDWVDRLEATIEAHVLPAARVRQACTIPGTSVRTAFLSRDKPAMKEALRAAGIPCAESAAVHSPAEVHAFAERVGFPLILKPRDAAGAAGTWRADTWDELHSAIGSCGIDRGRSFAIEEFNEGHEAFYDTLSIDGQPVLEFISHYYPNVLEAMRTRWISPQILTTNRIDAPDYEEVKQMGRRVITALGIGTSATHMEWFFGPKGLRFSEIGCRPPGVAMWDLYAAANEFDIYRQWAMALVHGRVDQQPSRRYAAGMITLRPDRDGNIVGYDGLDQVFNELGESIIDHHFPPAGSPTQEVGAGYMANAWMRLRHPDYDELQRMLDYIGRTVQVRAG